MGGPSFTAATIPTAIQFVATTAPTSVGNYITPLLFSVSGTGSSAIYTLVAAAKSISVNRAGLQTASLLFPAFTPSSTASFVLGYSDRNMSVSTGTLTTTSSNTGNIGMDYLSNNGTWLAYEPSSNFLLTNTFGVSGTSFTQVAAQRSYAFSAFQGLAQAGSGSVSRPNTDTSSANSYIYTGASYTTSFVPTRIRFYANAPGTITPMLFSYTSGGTYQVAAVGSPISVSSTQLGMVDTGVYFPTLGSLVTGTTYLFGYKNSATGVVAVQNGASTTGNWLYTATGLSGVGISATFATAGIYSLDIIASQTAGSAAISRASLDTATGQAYINPTQTYLTPTVSGFGGNGAGWTLAKNASGPATVANDVLTLTSASMSSIFNGYWNNTPLNGLASAPWTTSFTFNDTTGTLTDGGSFIIQTQGTSALGNSWYGSGINPSVAFSWNLYNNTAGGTTIGVNTGGIVSFPDTPGSVNMGLNSPTNVVLSYDGVGNITVSLTQGANTFTKTYAANLSGLDSNAFIGFAGGQGGALATTQISNFRFATEAPVLPSAMQVYATVPSTGSGWITPMLFQVGGTSGAQTYTVVAAATSVEITATGSTLLPVEFDPTVMSTLNPGGTFVMGFSHRQVDIATGGSFSTLSTTAGMVQYASGGSWLATGSLSPTGLVLGQSFASSALTGGRIYSVTFLTDATQYDDYSFLTSVQYNGGQQVYVSYADINESSTDLKITADAINQASIPNVENLALSGAEDVEVAIAATRQFTLMLDASVITSGASAGNTQLQANADPVTTGVLTSIAVQPGTQPFGVDGFLSSIIPVSPSNQVFTTAPVITISDQVTPGVALFSSTAVPAYGKLPDLNLGQYAGFTVQAWFNSTNIGSDWQRIIDLGNGAGNNNIIVGVVGSQLFMSTFNGITGVNLIAGPILASNTWNHVSAVFNGTTGSLYLNGVLVGTQAGMPQTQNVARTYNYWGKSNWSGDPVWQGQQDELRFWNRVLTASEISANYNTVVTPYPGSGLIGQYHADETSGTTLTDSSGNNKNATLKNSIANPVAYGSYESPVLASGGYTYNITNAGWTFSGESGIASNGSPWYVPAAPNGTQAAFIQRTGAISQSLSITTAGEYSLSCKVIGRGGFPANSINVYLDGIQVGTINASEQNSSTWIKWNSKSIKLSVGNHSLKFQGVGSGSADVDSAIDAVQLDYMSRSLSSAPLISKGSGATALANLDPSTGKLASITLTNPGSGYTHPFVKFDQSNTAKAVATMTSAGTVKGITLTSGGNYYAAVPVVTIVDRKGQGVGATATAKLTNGVVTGIVVSTGGTGYVSPAVIIAPPTHVTLTREALIPVPTVTITDSSTTDMGATATVSLDGNGYLTGIVITNNQATATPVLANGGIGSITLNQGGQFYNSVPTVTLSDSGDGTGSGATATATVVNGIVTAITVTNTGSNYTAPVVTLSPPSVFNSGFVNPVVTFTNNAPATATATIQSGALTAITLTNGAKYYGTTPPTITITGGGGSGASATATVFNGVITAITLNSVGTGYTSVPIISIAPPITATATVTQGVQNGILSNLGAFYTTTPNVTITDSSGNGTGALAYAVMEGGLVVDIVVTNYGTNYLTPLISIDPPTLDLTQTPSGTSTLYHQFYFLDGSSWSTSTTSSSTISLQYQLIDHFTTLDNMAGAGLTGGNGNSGAAYYDIAAYINPLLSSASPTYAETENLSVVMPETSNSPLLWYVSASTGSDPFISQALFPNNQWNVATLGAVTMGNVDLFMNLAGNNGTAGFTGTAQVGYVDFNLVADSFTPDVDFELQTTPGLFANFDTWHSTLSDDTLLAKNASTSAIINSYDLTLNALVSQPVSQALGNVLSVGGTSYSMPYYTSANPYAPNTTTNPIPNITFSVNSAGVGSFSNANFGNAEAFVYIDNADLGNSFNQISTALALTDNASYLGNLLPFVGGTVQDLTGFSTYFTDFVQDNLVGAIPDNFDSLIAWVADNRTEFTLAYGPITVGTTLGFGLYLTPTDWSDSVSATTQVAFDVATFASLAGGFNASNLPTSQSDLTYTVIPPANSGNITLTLDASWKAPFGALLTKSGSGTGISYQAVGYFAGSSNTKAWNLANITLSGNNLDFQGSLGTTPIYFESDTADAAKVSLTGGGIQTNLASNQLATAVVASSLSGSVNGGSYAANLPVYYPTITCYSGNFTVTGVNGATGASLVSYMAQEALYTAQVGTAGALTGFTKVTGGANYATLPQVVILDAAGVGTGATATATLSGGAITGVTLTGAGTGYVSPVVSFVGGVRNSTNPTGSKSVSFTLPDITNADIAALSLANAVGDPNIFQSGIGALQAALSKVFAASMGSQIIIGTGTSQFAQAFDTYTDIANYLDKTLTPFVPQCDQSATATATINASGVLTAIQVVTTGEMYTSTPLVTISDTGGTGSGATAIANMVSDGNGGQKVGSLTITNGGSGYSNPVISIQTPVPGEVSADAQLYSEATTVYNTLLATPGLVLASDLVLSTGSYLNSQTNTTINGALPTFLDANYNILTFSTANQAFVNSQLVVTAVESVEFPLIIDYTLENTTIPFSFGLPGIPLTIDTPLSLLESGTAVVDLSFGVDAFNGFFIIPNATTQFQGTVLAGPAANFSTTMTLGFLSGTMSAQTGDIFSMPFSSVLTDPDKDGQLTLAELNKLTPSSMFQTTLDNPTLSLEIDLELKVAGGGITSAIPGIGNTMSISWVPGENAPTLSYNNFYINMGSFISDFMGSIAPQLLPITNGVQPILNALNTPLPVLSEIIGGDTSLLGLANRFGAANTGFITALNSIAEMLTDITSAVNYINQNPGVSYHVPIAAVATFADDFRSAASGLSKPKQTSQLPSKQQSIDAVNSYLNQYQNAAANEFTKTSSKVINQDYGSSGDLGISFDILDPQNIINLITGQTADIFHINFPTLSASFSIEEAFELYGPLFLTFGGGVSAEVNLSIGFDSAGLEQMVKTTSAAGGNLSTTAMAGLIEDVFMDGLFIDSDNTAITADAYVSMGVMLNGGLIKAGVEGKFNLDLSMTPNVDADGRLNLSEMVELAGANFSSPLNLFDFDFKGTISADAYLKVFLPFKWKKVWSHNFGSFTVFDIKNDPAAPTPKSSSNGSLFLNMGPTANRRSHHGRLENEHFEIRHLGGVAGNETLSVQFYVDGLPQYVDSQGNPAPQVYHNIDKVVGIAGEGDDTIDCAGVLSPTQLIGGGGKDLLIGGLGANHLDGGPGADQLYGGPLVDTILGGQGTDTIHGGGGTDAIDGGLGDDTIDHPEGGATIHFGDRFGNDTLSPTALQNAILDFSSVTGNLTVTLGATNTIQIGTNHAISWVGAGPKSILLGQGEDTVVFTPGYSSTLIDTGAGRDRIEINAFENGKWVKIFAPGTNGDNQILVKTAASGEVVADNNGIHSNGAQFEFDWLDVRKLNIHETNATVKLNFADNGATKVTVFGREVDLLSNLRAEDVRLDAKNLLSIQSDITTTPGGSIGLITGKDGTAKIATDKNVQLSTTHGNIDLQTPLVYWGGKNSTGKTTIQNGAFENGAKRVIQQVPATVEVMGITSPIIVSAVGGTIHITDPTGKVLAGQFKPYPNFMGETRFNATADLNADGVNDIVNVPGPGGRPNLKVISGKNLTVLNSIYVFQAGFTGGLNVATGDVNGDGVKDIIVAADAGASPHVKVLSGKDYSVIKSFYAFATGFRGGVRVASADTNGDGLADIIVSTASGNSSHVKVFSGLDNKVLSSFFAFKTTLKSGGTFVSAADLNGDGRAEIISGMGAGNAPQVSVYNSATKALDNFMAYEANFAGGVRVGTTTRANGQVLVVTAPGRGGSPNVRTFDHANKFKQIDSFFAGPMDNISGVIL